MGRRLHRWLRRATLPASLEVRHGEAMGDAFADALDDVGTRRARIGLWLREVGDLVATGQRLRRERRRHGAAFVARRSRGTTRGGGGMNGGWDDIRYAARSLARRPAFTAFAVVTVGLGVGATTAIYSTLDAVLLNPVPYENADRMLTLVRPMGPSLFLTPGREQVEAWAEMDDVFEVVESMAARTLTLTGEGEPTRVEAGLIRPTFFDLTGRVPAHGRGFTADELSADSRVVMLGHDLWVARYGRDPAVLGRTLELEGEAWEIIGVMPPDTPLLSFGLRPVDLWRPLPPDTPTGPPTALLREGVTLEAANARLAVPVELSTGQTVDGIARSLVEGIGVRMRDTLRVLMAAVGVLLLIACLNVSNLLLSRADQRRRETAVRTALGSGRARLARQMLVEGLLLGGGGGLLGVGLASLGLEAILSFRPGSLSELDGVGLDAPVLVFALGVTLAASILFSLVPVWQSTRADALDALRSGARGEGRGTPGSRFRWLLVTGEVALSFALVVGSVLVVGALARLQSQDAGFRSAEVLAVDVRLPEWRYDSGEAAAPDLEIIEERIAALPGVIHVARSMGAPPRAGIAFGRVQVEGGEPTEERITFYGPPVDVGYFETLGQPLLRGRGFTPDEVAEGRDVVVLGEAAARRFFGSIDAVGRRMKVGEPEAWSTVVGVTVDVPMTGLAGDRGLQMYWPLPTAGAGDASFLVRAGAGLDPETLGGAVRETIHDVVPDARIDDLASMSTRLAGTLGRERFATTLMTSFAALALLLAAVGLYGVVSQVVGQRTREIGIRMTLGADRGDIRTLVLRQGALATIAGIVVGIGLSVVGLDVLGSQLSGLNEGGGPATFAVGALVIAALTLLATWIPARRATRVDPVSAIRVE